MRQSKVAVDRFVLICKLVVRVEVVLLCLLLELPPHVVLRVAVGTVFTFTLHADPVPIGCNIRAYFAGLLAWLHSFNIQF